MSILDVMAILGFGLGCFKTGYLVGRNAKNNRPVLRKLAVIL